MASVVDERTMELMVVFEDASREAWGWDGYHVEDVRSMAHAFLDALRSLATPDPEATDAERDRLEAENERLLDDIAHHYQPEMSALVELNERLRRALRPFARFACGCGVCHNCRAAATMEATDLESAFEPETEG